MSRSRPQLRVLLLDDRKEDRLLATRELRRAFSAVAVRDVIDAAQFQAAVDDGTFDIVITDFQLRWSTGLTIVETIKARYPFVPVIMFTATGSEEAAVDAMKAGLDDYVVKSPLHIVRLSVAIRAALERVRVRRDAEDERRRFLERERELRHEAEAASHAKDEFLAVLSHELRTPLTAIVGWARMLRSGRVTGADVDHAIDVIERNSLALGKLVEDLLDVSRMIAGRIHLDSRVIDLADVVQLAVEVVEPAANAKQIAVDLMPPDGLVQVSGDLGRLQQVVWNLLTNSVKFTPRGGRVRVSVQAEDGSATIRVSDSGPGLSPELLPRLFEPFRQADVSATRAHGGLGLGLTIVRHLTELHQGSVEVTSPGELGGATFIVRLPRVRSRTVVDTAPRGMPRAVAATSTTLPSLDGVRVLVVEDEPDTRELISTVLRQCGASVMDVTSAAEAHEAFARDIPHVLLSDIAMADEDGYEMLRKIRARPANLGGAIPAVAVTAYARDEDRLRATIAGYDRYLSKPVDPTRLCAAVAELLASTRR